MIILDVSLPLILAGVGMLNPAFFIAIMFVWADLCLGGLPYPKTRKETNLFRHFGFIYSDPYRWMENADTTELSTWVRKQNDLVGSWTGGSLRDSIREEFKEILDSQKVVVVTATKTADEVREAIEKTGKVAVLVGSGSSTGKIK